MLAVPLKKLGIPTTMTTLPFGDLAFEGHGASGPVAIGLEFKRIGDLVNSLRSGRFAGHQLPGLLTSYDYVWLLTEGRWQTDPQGLLATYQGRVRGWRALGGRMAAQELEKQLLTFELRGAIRLRCTATRRESLRFIAALYRWFTDKQFSEHRSHLTPHQTPTLLPLNPFRQAVCAWPGLGVTMSRRVERQFGGSVRRAVCASVADWQAIEGIGPVTAQRLVAFFDGRHRGSSGGAVNADES